MQAVTRYALEMLVRLADSYILPFNVGHYGDTIIKAQAEFEDIFGNLTTDRGISLGKL